MMVANVRLQAFFKHYGGNFYRFQLMDILAFHHPKHPSEGKFSH